MMLHVHVPRYYGHTAAIRNNYRTDEEKAAMRRDRDCLTIFRQKIKEVSLLELSELDTIDSEIETAIDNAVKAARAAPFPDIAALTTDVYFKYV